MANQHEWINSDKHLFGQPNTAYDFTSVDARETAKKLSRLEEQKVHKTIKYSWTNVSMRNCSERTVWLVAHNYSVILRI